MAEEILKFPSLSNVFVPDNERAEPVISVGETVNVPLLVMLDPEFIVILDAKAVVDNEMTTDLFVAITTISLAVGVPFGLQLVVVPQLLFVVALKVYVVRVRGDTLLEAALVKLPLPSATAFTVKV